jgi:multiple sugar transport system permease protein
MAVDHVSRIGQASRRRRRAALWPHLVAGVVLLALLYPVAWMVLTSLKPTSEIISSASLWPESWTLDNFAQGWRGAGIGTFGTFFVNSAIIAVACVVGNVVTCTLPAYAFAR